MKSVLVASVLLTSSCGLLLKTGKNLLTLEDINQEMHYSRKHREEMNNKMSFIMQEITRNSHKLEELKDDDRIMMADLVKIRDNLKKLNDKTGVQPGTPKRHLKELRKITFKLGQLKANI